MIRVTRRYQFSASHRLHAPGLSEEENQRLYGKCNNPFGHGHNYVLEVSVRGPVDARSGHAVVVGTLDRLVRERVLASLHLKNLNTDVEVFREVVPTTEQLTLEIQRQLEGSWRATFPGEWPRLDRVRIEETDNNFFEVRREGGVERG